MITSVAGESGSRAQQMRDQAEKIEQAAARATGPAERRRLKDKARRILDQSKKESERGSGDIEPHMTALHMYRPVAARAILSA
ncbi:DUF6381 family protein [Streptomyces katrae]|uniref:DUF6381 family protein n=1 Tax=Streptomyces katrae TaxID=68223 RepID=UPI00214F7653|nr:DUF6381 family protein [Streptomyces katrae]